MSLGTELVCFALLCQSPRPGRLENFIDSGGCREELRGQGTDFSLALDRKKDVFAEVRRIESKPTLLVLQYSDAKDSCGIVKDVVIAPDAKDVFEFECVDQLDANRVAVGIHPDGPFAQSWKASRAWIVDFQKLKLTPTRDPVTCINYSYAGADDGSDVRTRSAARAKQKSH